MLGSEISETYLNFCLRYSGNELTDAPARARIKGDINIFTEERQNNLIVYDFFIF